MCASHCTCYQARGGGPQLAGTLCDGAGLRERSACCRTEADDGRAVALSHEVSVFFRWFVGGVPVAYFVRDTFLGRLAAIKVVLYG